MQSVQRNYESLLEAYRSSFRHFAKHAEFLASIPESDVT